MYTSLLNQQDESEIEFRAGHLSWAFGQWLRIKAKFVGWFVATGRVTTKCPSSVFFFFFFKEEDRNQVSLY